MNWLSKTIHPHTNHSNYDLTLRSYHAWLIVKSEKLPSNMDYFVEQLSRLYDEVHSWLIAHPKRMSQYVESGGIRMEIHRWENGTLHARICLTTHYTID